MRVLVWLGVILLALLGRLLHSGILAAASVPVALAGLWLMSPQALRGGILAVAACAAGVLIAGGPGCMLDALPALIAALVGWIFARSLLHGRTALIARAIAAIDGAQQLDDATVVRYAKRLTMVWALYQLALAVLGAMCVAHAHGALAALSLPSPAAFAALLPIAIGALFLGEFALRPRLIPQAPRHGLFSFLRDLVRVWPDLLDD